jgi:DNA-binding LytR/AlgR family response regulator
MFSAGVAAPMSLVSWGLALLVFGPSASADAWTFIWPTLLISGAMTALFMSLNAPGPQTHATPGGAANIRLRERLPANLRSAEIFAVSAEDHYLRVHTSGGSTLILLRLSDAVEELEGIEGALVHRSWWVSRAAIVEPRRAGRNVSLAVKGDLLVPVSRPNVRALQESGWL